MPPYPSYTSCTLIVDIPWSQNATILLFNDILKGTAKETMKKYIEMMEYLSSLLPTVSTKVSAMWQKRRKALPNMYYYPIRFHSRSKETQGLSALFGAGFALDRPNPGAIRRG